MVIIIENDFGVEQHFTTGITLVTNTVQQLT